MRAVMGRRGVKVFGREEALMQAVLVGVVLEAVIIIMVMLLYALLRRMDLMGYQLKDALRRLDALDQRRDPPEGPITNRERVPKR
jgi:hypothetical protein